MAMLAIVGFAVKIDAILTPFRRRHTKLQTLLNQAARQEGWTLELRAVLPAALANACRVIDIRGNTLVVLCADGAVATRLRFQGSEIVDQLRVLKHYSQVERLEIRVSRAD